MRYGSSGFFGFVHGDITQVQIKHDISGAYRACKVGIEETMND